MQDNKDFIDFQPFYTLQPHASTRQKQLNQWSNIVIEWCLSTKIDKILKSSIDNLLIFQNHKISRCLKHDDIIMVFDYMVKIGKCEEIEDSYIIYNKSIVEYSVDLCNYIISCGSNNGVFSVYELINSIDTKDESFHNIDQHIMLKVLNYLSNQGKCAIIKSSEIGVKFNL